MKKFTRIVQYMITTMVVSGFSIIFLYNFIPLILNPTIYSDRKEYIREEFSCIEPVPGAVKKSEHTLNKFTEISITVHYLVEDDIPLNRPSAHPYPGLSSKVCKFLI